MSTLIENNNFLKELRELLEKYDPGVTEEPKLIKPKYLEVELGFDMWEFPTVVGYSDTKQPLKDVNNAVYRLVSEGETVVRNAGIVGKTFLDPITGEPVETYPPN